MVSRDTHLRIAVTRSSLSAFIGIVLVLMLSLAFVKLTREIAEQEVAFIDRPIALAIHSTTTDTQTIVMRFITDLGAPYLLVLAVLVTAMALIVAIRNRWFQRDGLVITWAHILAPILTLAVAGGLSSTIKVLIGRVRPSLFTPLVPTDGFSFPSGHTLTSLAFYGMCGYLLARHAAPLARTFIMAATVILIGLIAYSRVYLGAHYPTDVLGSLLLGLAWLISAIIGLQYIEHHLRLAQQAPVSPADGERTGTL